MDLVSEGMGKCRGMHAILEKQQIGLQIYDFIMYVSNGIQVIMKTLAYRVIESSRIWSSTIHASPVRLQISMEVFYGARDDTSHFHISARF